MGDPRRLTSHVRGPGHPWQKERIEEERILLNEYGLKNKQELWRLSTKVKDFTQQAKRLIAATGKQADLEKQQLFHRLQRIGLVHAGAKLDDVLSLTLKNILDRRLQTLVFRKGFSRSVKQARQFISHQHVSVGGKIVSAPSYIVPVIDENTISIIAASGLSKADHPERVPLPPKKKSAAREQRHGDRRGGGFRRGRRSNERR
ncbi:MAG TPA: 30S ribosomal protein S4 [Candidatus Binatia bacterium]|nr:30S ribosomal protein S4 [Candidatus Binatia bacterium]